MRKIEITPDQSMLAQAAERYLRDNYSFEDRAARLAGPAEGRIWSDFADMGWLGLPFGPGHGGSGGSMLDLALLLEHFGRRLVVEPFIPTVVLAGRLLERHGSQQQIARWLPHLLDGRMKAALAVTESDAGYCPAQVATAQQDGRMSGHKSVVLGGDEAGLLILPVRWGATQDIALVAIERDRPGITVRPYRLIDGRGAAEVVLADVPVSEADLIGHPADGLEMLEEAMLAGTVALLGEAVGVLEGAVSTTAAYLNMRRQFDRPLSSFQALRHRVADMFVLKEETKALCRMAADAFDSESGNARLAAVAGAAAYVGRFGRRICEEAVQLHGAIAITDEYVVGHYLKRIIMIDRFFGDSDVQMDAYIASAAPFAARASRSAAGACAPGGSGKTGA